jgi:hypothetical protein
MVRREVEIGPEQEAKLKRLAAVRGCSEEELVREAIDRLPEEEPAWVGRLRERGLLVDYGPPRTTREERERRLEALHKLLRAEGGHPRLVEAVLEDRDESDRVL